MNLIEEMLAQHGASARIEAQAALSEARGNHVLAVHLLAAAIEKADAWANFGWGDTLCCAIWQLVVEEDEDEYEDDDDELTVESLCQLMTMAMDCNDLSRKARRILVVMDIGRKRMCHQHTLGRCMETLGAVTAEIADRGDVEFALKLLQSLGYGSSDVLACAALARVLTLQGRESMAYTLVAERKEEADEDEPTGASVFIELLIAAAHHSQGNRERAEEIVLALQDEGGLEILAEDLNSVVLEKTRIAQKLLEQAAAAVDLCDGATARFMLLYAETVEED
jgi:hypothetical protein